MRTEEEIREYIKELEDLNDPENDFYLDEGEQAALEVLYWVLGETDNRW